MIMIVAPEYYCSAWRGERAPEIPVTKSVRVNFGGLANISFVGYIKLPTGLRSHVTTWFSG